jgi:hypothetical protein
MPKTAVIGMVAPSDVPCPPPTRSPDEAFREPGNPRGRSGSRSLEKGRGPVVCRQEAAVARREAEEVSGNLTGATARTGRSAGAKRRSRGTAGRAMAAHLMARPGRCGNDPSLGSAPGWLSTAWVRCGPQGQTAGPATGHDGPGVAPAASEHLGRWASPVLCPSS